MLKILVAEKNWHNFEKGPKKTGTEGEKLGIYLAEKLKPMQNPQYAHTMGQP